MIERIRTLLPIGTVVSLKGIDRKMVISGYLQEWTDPETEKVTRYDYAGIPYPVGYLDEESTCAFSREAIEQVVYRGYEDNTRLMFLQKLSDAEEMAADRELHMLEEL